MKHRRIFQILALAIYTVLPAWGADVTSEANIPSYYSGADNTSGSSLVSALTTIARTNISPLAYGSGTCTDCVWGAFGTTDIYPTDASHPDYDASHAGYIWDIYADCNYTFQDDQGSSGSECNNGYNREHSMPKSWFGGGTDVGPGTDLFHIYPSDVYVNTLRNNYPFGVVGSPTYTSTNGGKYGKCTWPDGYTGYAFEPVDYLKGDLARGYFYMIITWNAYNTSTYSFTQDTDGNGSIVFNNDISSSGNFGLTAFGLELLLKWHRDDPVSQKEIDRNNAVQSLQGNRNPFIDYPCLVEYIWGNKSGETVDIDALTPGYSAIGTDGCPCDGPTITSPTGTIDIGTTNTSTTISQTVTVLGTNLESGSLTLSLSGTNASYFSLSTTSINQANAEAGYDITIYYSPSANGSHTATLSISGCGLTSTHTVTLTGTCTTTYSVTWMDKGSSYHSNMSASDAQPTLPEAPDDCSTDRVFVGWTETSGYSSTSTAPNDLFTTSDDAPAITEKKTFYAVYADASTTGSGVAQNTVLWAEDFSGYSSGDVPDGNITNAQEGTTVYSGTISYSVSNGGGTTKIYDAALAGGTTPELLIAKSNGSFTITNIPTGGATEMTLTFKTNQTGNMAVSSGTSGISVGSVSISSGTATCVITNSSSVENFALTITKENSGNSRVDDFSLIVSSSGSTTTYSNYSTQCSACTPVAATASFANSSVSTTCGGTVSNAFTTNSNATVEYSSSNTDVATVNSSTGEVTVVSAGTTTITATVPANTCYTGGASDSYTLTVNSIAGTASFTSPTTSVSKSETVTNTVTTNSDGTVSYSSSNTAVATVNASTGEVTGVAAGTATITASVAASSCYSATSANYTITVYDFEAEAATDITCSSFTANWTSAGTSSYSLDVYTGTSTSTTTTEAATFYEKSFASDIDNWTINNVSGYTSVWSYNSSYYCAYATSYISGTRYAAESWLISPSIDLTDAEEVTLTLSHVFRYSSDVSMKISTDDGVTWSDLTLSPWSTASSWSFASSTADLVDYKGQTIKLALVYIGTTSACPTWEVESISVAGTKNVTTITSSVVHVTGYPKDVTGTSASVTGLDASTTYKYTVTPEGGSVSDEIEVTTPACATTVGEQLDIVDWTATTLTINTNTNTFASSGWPYTINDVEYTKSDRQTDRTLIIPCTTSADGELEITVQSGGSTVSKHTYTMPHIYESDATLSGTTATSNVFVRGGTLTVSSDASVNKLYIAPTAGLTVNSGITLTVDSLMLRTTPWNAAVLTNNGTISATSTYYTRVIADNSQFYWFAIPLASNTSNVTLSDGSACGVSSTVAPYGQAWILRYYDTSSRAENGIATAGETTNWTNLGASGSTYTDADIEASTGYELFSGSNYYREYYFPVTLPTSATSVDVTYATGSAGTAHAGWNILCSPYTHTHSVTIDDPATALKICQMETDGSYTQTQPTSIAPAMAFAYQTSANGSLSFESNSFTFAAPQRREASELETEWIALELYADEQISDETHLYSHPERFENAYKIGIDVAKQSLSAARPLLYSTHSYGDMAFAGIPDSILTAGVPIVVYSPSEQPLRIAMRDNNFLHRLQHLYITNSENGSSTDLMVGDYSFTAGSGTNNRFRIQAQFKTDTPTGIEPTAITGEVQVYDALGRYLYRGPIEHIGFLPAGVYILRTPDNAHRITIHP